MDHLSRLTERDWEDLRTEIEAKRNRVVAFDLPTFRIFVALQAYEFMGRIFGAINGMLLEVLAAVATKEYDDRRCRQEQEKLMLSWQASIGTDR